MKSPRLGNYVIWQRIYLQRKLFTSSYTPSSLLSWTSYIPPYENILKSRQLTTISNFSGFNSIRADANNPGINWSRTIKLIRYYSNLSFKLTRISYSLLLFISNEKNFFSTPLLLNSPKSSFKLTVCNFSKYL